ncbi:ubiquitin carboxyl-terminal hydrolase 40 isoform X1 [Hippocampus zosterae]|uniref:ubiquitin carboxyl-terminal hydrolase 40 isoform X1 n=2 Tax=Hippocampus zosterae TaxID=109293 RepID=UPI00223D97CD|nr:ubiquitin carboxyl-terminal hydrolase 40 isoform X1 [Hippocampus zosterae]XP_051941259.1 ubiquitin carboxyl-terminal hydrolase 40 isoform X1 [Hippocampus zosterae]
MFGNLFEEGGNEGEAGVSVFSTTGGARFVKAGDEPPSPRGRSKLCGIRNQGGTCYLNSLLQTLLFTPEFREELFALGTDELGCLEDKHKPGAKVRVIPLELQRLFARLLLVDQQSASTADLTDSFGWNSNERTNQHDVQELNRILFSALEKSLVGTSGSTLIRRLYHGTIVNSIVCKECGNVSQRQEDFLDLTACVCGVSGLEEALCSMFVEEELFEGNNLYRCATCDRLVTAAKSAKLKKLPPFMTMSLLRFSFDCNKFERYKETGRYSFPLTINLRPFCEQTDGEDADYSYELFSVIIHKGGCYGGHYHVHIKDIECLGCWEPAEEDSNKKKTPPKPKREVKDVCETRLDENDPLCVLTAILDQEPSKSIRLDQLGQKVMEKVGSSWSKAFKRDYGPIGKFLQSHNDVFMLASNGTQVGLKAETLSPVSEPPCPAHHPTAADLEGGTVAELEGHREASHWFDLNDSTVTSIRASDIEKQFQGKESAYMLFYRKSQLQRPADALGNPHYKVPHALIQMAQEENMKLQQMREEYEASHNHVEVRIHLASSYQLRNGALQPIDSEPNASTALVFDRRKTVGDLRLAIYEQQEQWEGDLVLTLAKMLPAGLHLYNTLTDDSVLLCSAGIDTNRDLFVWNGREVCGAGVLTGVEWEPVLLTVVRPSLEAHDKPEAAAINETGDNMDGGGLKKEAMAFAGGATLGEVREALGQPAGSLLCQEQTGAKGGGECGAGEGGGASGWRVFSPDDMFRTLKELSLKDGDAMLVLEPQSFDNSMFTVNGDVVTVMTPSDCRWLQVEFQPQGARLGGGGEEDSRRVKVPAAGDTLLREVKQRALKELQLPGAEYCLRQMDISGKLLPPVSEDLCVRDAGVRLMTTVMLCLGRAPEPSQLFLHFSVGSPPPAGIEEMDMNIEKTCTVKECLQTVLNTAGIDGTCWHLRRLDWCEEVGEALNDEDASLAEMKINNGETLVISEGRLPPKGFLELSVWLYRDAVSIATDVNHTENGHAEEQLAEDHAVDQTNSHPSDLINVGTVEISEEVSLADLKTQVLTLPAFQNACVPATFLRVWEMEGCRLARVLRGNQITLRKLKITSGTNVCVQRLLKEEALSPKEIVLNIKMGVPGQSCYHPAEELIWNASCDSSPAGLRAFVAESYGLPADSLLLAKQQPHKHTWEEIGTWSSQLSKKKKKTSSLLGAPFHLKDGDVIGVRNLLIDDKDFYTRENEQSQQGLREQAEQQSIRERAGGSNCVGSQTKATKRPEVPLSINVGVFSSHCH